MAGSAYLVGRQLDDLAKLLEEADKTGTKIETQDRLFAATRLDEKNIKDLIGGRFAHCTFANVAFKGITLKEVNFEDCTFIACYFRKATWSDCRFQSCRFLDSQFQGLQILNSRFFYCRFSDCFIPYNRIRQSLPPQANLRRELAHNLATEAGKLGFSDEARRFRWCELEANEEHLKGAVSQEDPWYRSHYPSFRDQLRAEIALIASRLNRELWGYGERGRVLLRNIAVLVVFLFPLTFYVLSWNGDLRKDSGSLSLGDFIYFSVQHVLEPTISSGVTPSGLALWFAAFEGLLGVIIAGLLVSYLFQWILRR